MLLAILAPVLALVWLGFHFFRHDDRVYSIGRLSGAHAVLEKQCAACHLQQQGSFSATAVDSACLACHDGPPHHASSMNAKLSCAECHAEHRGRVHLAATRNQSCAQCHGDLSPRDSANDYAKHIRSFEHGHPEFAALRLVDGKIPPDPGTIKLNHVLHMHAIRRGPTGPMVHLDCDDCHRPAASRTTDWQYGDAHYRSTAHAYTDKEEFREVSSRGLTASRAESGRELMAPPKFANACAGCHLLTFDKRFDEGVPHDKPQVIQAYLVKKFSDYVAAHPGELNEEQDPRRNLTGGGRGPALRSLSPTQWVAERVAVAEELLWHKTCSQCHAVAPTPLQDVKIARWDAAKSHEPARVLATVPAPTPSAISLPEIAPASSTLQWLPHARFDHDAHRGFSCTGCHQNVLTSTETSDVLIPGISMCQTCHAPGPGYAESRCFECHTYHNWAQRKEVKPTFTMPVGR